MYSGLRGLCGLVFAAVAITGCAGIPAHQPLTSDSQAGIGSTDVIANVPQRELTADINESNFTAAAGGGLIWALVDTAVNSSRSNTAEEAVRPLRDAMLDLQFDSLFVQSLDAKLAGLYGANKASLTKTVTPKDQLSTYQASTRDAVLMVGARYSMSADFSTLSVSAFCQMLPRSERLLAAQGAPSSGLTSLDGRAALYRNTITYSSALPVPSRELAENRDRWSANRGELLMGAIRQGVEEVTEVLRLDLQGQSAAPGSTGAGGAQRVLKGDGTVAIFNPAISSAFATAPRPAVAAIPAAAAAAPAPAMAAPSPVSAAANLPVTPAATPVPAAPPAATPSARLVATSASAAAPAVPSEDVVQLPRSAVLRAQPRKATADQVILPAGAFVKLVKKLSNEEGNWWYISLGQRSGWIVAPAAVQ